MLVYLKQIISLNIDDSNSSVEDLEHLMTDCSGVCL